MKVVATALPEVLIFEPQAFGDARGSFMQAFNEAQYTEHGIADRFVQDNVSRSRRGVLRGLHFQHPYAQGKLVFVLEGEVFDVAVDVRVDSPTFGHWVGETLSAANRRQLYLPPGFAHGFVVTSQEALFSYKCTEYYHPEDERSIRWDDPALAIAWPMRDVELSAKDRAAPTLHDVPAQYLPPYRRG